MNGIANLQTPKSLCVYVEKQDWASARGLAMRVYYEPLVAYLVQSQGIREEVARDTVGDFISKRMTDPQFFVRWQSARAPMRHWLRRCIANHVASHFRREKSRAKAQEAFAIRASATKDDHDPKLRFTVEVARRLIIEAFHIAEQRCREDGLLEHWEAFIEHVSSDRTFAEMASRAGLSAKQLRIKARSAQTRWASALRDLIRHPGMTSAEVDAEIHSLMEALRSS